MSKNNLPVSVFQKTVGCWADKQYPGMTNKALCIHLKKEVEELFENFDPVEAADCFLILLHFAHKNDFDLLEEAIKKQEINLKRKWETVPDKDGLYRHIGD